MTDMEKRRARYTHDFYITKFTLPVVKQMSGVMPGGFFIYKEDEKQELIYANKRVLEIFGCETQEEFRELTGYTFKGMVAPQDFEKVQASIDDQIDAEDGSGVDHVEYRILRKDGEIRWVDDYGHYSYSPEYGDIYYVFIFDITEQRAERKAEKKLAAAAAAVLEDLERLQVDVDGEARAHMEGLKKELDNIMQ